MIDLVIIIRGRCNICAMFACPNIMLYLHFTYCMANYQPLRLSLSHRFLLSTTFLGLGQLNVLASSP